MCVRAYIALNICIYCKKSWYSSLLSESASTNSNSEIWNSAFTRIHINIVTGKHKNIKCRSCFVSCTYLRRLCDRQQIAVVVISNVIPCCTQHITMQYSSRLRKHTSHWIYHCIYRAFHNVLRDYKKLLYENRWTCIYETCTNRTNNSKIVFPSKLFFIAVHISTARRCEGM